MLFAVGHACPCPWASILFREGTHSIGVTNLRKEGGLKLSFLSESSGTYLVCTLSKKYAPTLPRADDAGNFMQIGRREVAVKAVR